MTRLTSFLLAALLVPTAWGRGGPRDRAAQPQDPEPTWHLVNGVAFQAGEDVVTHKDLEEIVRYEAARREISSPEELDVLTWEVAEYMMTAILEPQAGRDLGFDQELLEDYQRRQQRLERRQTGALKLSEDLQSRGRTFLRHEEAEEDRLYRDLWMRYVRGDAIGLPGVRPHRDRFVRPGQVYGVYHTLWDQPVVQFRIAIVEARAWGGVEQAREGLENARRAIEEGDDFERVRRLELGAQKGGLQEELPLNQIVLPELQEFGAAAEVGDVSPPIVLPGEPTELLLAQLVAREEPDLPDYGLRSTQSELRERFRRDMDLRLLGLERRRLLERSYRWAHSVLLQARQTAEAARQGEPR